jgi:hypothetical protein
MRRQGGREKDQKRMMGKEENPRAGGEGGRQGQDEQRRRRGPGAFLPRSGPPVGGDEPLQTVA